MSELAFSPAAERNRAPIWGVLDSLISALTHTATSGHRRDTGDHRAATSDQELEATTRLLEIASGSGQHAAYFASQHRALKIYPTDRTLERAHSVAGWAYESGVSERVAPLCVLDASAPSSAWPSVNPHIIYCANMIHISPWEATEGLFAGAGAHLSRGGLLVTYGPYRFGDTPLAPSNLAFEESLRARDPRWGIRAVESLDALAAHDHLERIETHALPANNHLLVYRRL